MKIERSDIIRDMARGRRIYIGMVLPNNMVRYIHCEGEVEPLSTEDTLLNSYRQRKTVMELMKYKHIVLLPSSISYISEFVYSETDSFNTYDIKLEDFMKLDNVIWGGKPFHNSKFLWLDGEWYYSYDMGNIHELARPNVFYTLMSFIKQKGLETKR